MARHDPTLTEVNVRRVALVVSATCLTGCAIVLGGLDEGSPRADVDASTLTEAGARDAAPPCPGAVPGYRFRRLLTIDRNAARTTDYTVTVPLPSEELLRVGKVQPDGADYLVTDDEGRPLPFALDPKPGGGIPARALVRLDLRKPTQAWLHYGNPGASRLDDPFAPYAPGLVDDPTFIRRDAWTMRTPSDPSARWSVAYEDEGIRLAVSRPSGDNGTVLAACQTVTFPAGSAYRIVFDTSFSREGYSSAEVVISDIDRYSVWAHSNVEGEASLTARGEETVTFPEGTRVLCVSTGVSRGGRVDARFSRIRVRRVAIPEHVAPSEPVVTLGAEEPSCP